MVTAPGARGNDERLIVTLSPLQKLQKLRNEFEADLASARNRRAEAITRMNVADAEILFIGTAIDRVDRELAKEKKT